MLVHNWFGRAGVQAGACVAVVVLLCQVSGAQANDRGTQRIVKEVRHELVMLPYLSVFDNISFRVTNGTVELFGQVVRPTLKSDAGNVVKRIEGVTRVENHIEVLPLSPFDNRIRVSTARAIYGFNSLYRYGLGTNPSIRIIVKNGNVTLAGVVNSEADRNIAYIRANSVPGVFSVTNDLRVVK